MKLLKRIYCFLIGHKYKITKIEEGYNIHTIVTQRCKRCGKTLKVSWK